MIQKIVKDSDIKFNVSEDSKIQDKFIIKFYTVSKSTVITKTAENVIEEEGKRYIKLNWSELRHLENGMINYEVNNLDSDADYNDGVYNSTFSRTTYYYLYTESNSGGGGAGTEEIEQKIDDLNSRVSGVETKVDQIITDLNKEKEDRAQGDTNLTNTITENDAQYQRKFNRHDRVYTTYYQYIQDLQNRVTELELLPRVTALETGTQDIQNRLTAAYSRYEDIGSRYGWKNSYSYYQFNESMTALEQKVTALETKTQDIQNSMPVVEPNNGINDRALTLETDTQDLKESLLLADRVTALETKDNGYKERMSSVENNLDDFDAKFPKDTNSADIKQKVTLLADRVTALETGTQDLKESLPVVEPNNDSLKESMPVVTNNDGIANQSLTLEERVTALESKYEDFGSSLFSVEHGVEDVSGDWPPSVASYKDIQERLSTLENRIKALESK